MSLFKQKSETEVILNNYKTPRLLIEEGVETKITQLIKLQNSHLIMCGLATRCEDNIITVSHIFVPAQTCSKADAKLDEGWEEGIKADIQAALGCSEEEAERAFINDLTFWLASKGKNVAAGYAKYFNDLLEEVCDPDVQDFQLHSMTNTRFDLDLMLEDFQFGATAYEVGVYVDYGIDTEAIRAEVKQQFEDNVQIQKSKYSGTTYHYGGGGGGWYSGRGSGTAPKSKSIDDEFAEHYGDGLTAFAPKEHNPFEGMTEDEVFEFYGGFIPNNED